MDKSRSGNFENAELKSLILLGSIHFITFNNSQNFKPTE